MESTNYFPIISNECSDHQAIRTQIDSDVDWDQFWREYNNLNPDFIASFDVTWISPCVRCMEVGEVMDSRNFLEATETNILPPSPIKQFQLPSYGSNLIFPTFLDPSQTPTWTDPSTSNSSPSATSSRTSNSTSSASSPDTAPSSVTSEGSFSCRFCSQTFAQKCLLNRHTNTHTKPYRCSFPDCTERRATNRDLKRHMVVHDPVSAPAYLCTEKGCMYAVKGFKRKDNLKRHMENIHSGLIV